MTARSPLRRLLRFAALALAVSMVAGCSNSTGPIPSQLSNLSTPINLFNLAIEARESDDIADDTAIFVSANGALLDAGVFTLATEIYEQQLLVTGLLNDVAACDSLRSTMAAIKGVKQLYWHVLCVTREEQRSAGAIGDFRRAILRTKVSLRLFGTAEVSDVNLRVAVDSQRNAILLGRVRSDEEKAAALAAAGADEGIRSVISYVEIRS